MPFVGRERELRTLEQLYETGAFQMPVIYGRRRVGKTSLINKFIEGKPAIVFTARESSARENLVALSKALADFLQAGDIAALDAPAPVFESFDAAFDHVFRIARIRRLVFVIDEYPYLAQSYRPVSSLLQAKIDEEKEASGLFLVLCGSSMSFMEHQVLGYQSPLYGRRTAQIKVEPFDVFDSAKLLEGLSAEDVVAWYGMVGGVPLYLEQCDASATLERNMAENVLRVDSFLYGEPDSYLQQELRDPAMYNAITRAVATGIGRPSEIADAAGVETAAVTGYLKSLIELGVVRKEQPVVDANRKKVRYRIADNLFRFWYRFVPQYATPLQAGRHEEIARLIEERHLSTYLGPTFEDVCRQWLLREMGASRVPLILDIGRWWGNDPARREQAEIDIVALCDEGEVLFAECKWREKPVDADVLETLEHRTRLIPADRRLLFAFSKTGFTEACRDRANAMGATLVSLDEMGL
ncbi:ATP-binding protein [Arabiibacter massiliensis]|uniref:ATP-binding protein n=1 Tax=Arabiibacter massiliensis TaxID=1870985 RepID=UPI0009BAE3CF|nr:ATP-binding protein [Arabiibacter massiliensis]